MRVKTSKVLRRANPTEFRLFSLTSILSRWERTPRPRLGESARTIGDRRRTFSLSLRGRGRGEGETSKSCGVRIQRRFRLFSLTSFLSRWERDATSASQSARTNCRASANVLPLPAGEGRGEGESVRSPVRDTNQRTLPPFSLTSILSRWERRPRTPRLSEVRARDRSVEYGRFADRRRTGFPTHEPLLSRPAATLSSPSEGEEREGRGVVRFRGTNREPGRLMESLPRRGPGRGRTLPKTHMPTHA